MKEKILMIVFVLILGTILTSSLVAVDKYTEPIIKKNELKRLRLSVMDALDISLDRKSTRLNSSHIPLSRMPSSA